MQPDAPGVRGEAAEGGVANGGLCAGRSAGAHTAASNTEGSVKTDYFGAEMTKDGIRESPLSGLET